MNVPCVLVWFPSRTRETRKKSTKNNQKHHKSHQPRDSSFWSIFFDCISFLWYKSVSCCHKFSYCPTISGLFWTRDVLCRKTSQTRAIADKTLTALRRQGNAEWLAREPLGCWEGGWRLEFFFFFFFFFFLWLVLKGNYDYWTYFVFFPGVLSKWKGVQKKLLGVGLSPPKWLRCFFHFPSRSCFGWEGNPLMCVTLIQAFSNPH